MSGVRGGNRAGAGRKLSFGEPTTVVRVPVSAASSLRKLVEQNVNLLDVPPLNILKVRGAESISIPLYHFSIAAGATTGFASPAQDYEEELDLGSHLVKKKASTFAFRVGKNYDSMIDVGIMPGCHLLIDKSLKIRHGRIVVAAVAGEWVVKRLHIKDGVLMLLSENRIKNYPPIVFKEEEELYIFGVVKNVVTDL